MDGCHIAYFSILRVPGTHEPVADKGPADQTIDKKILSFTIALVLTKNFDFGLRLNLHSGEIGHNNSFVAVVLLV
jgi:hypothetical protein